MSSTEKTLDRSLLFLVHQDAVRQLLASLVDAAVVDDLLQEVFVKAIRGLSGFRGEAETRTWLLRIARNRALDHLRSRRHREDRQTCPLPSDQDVESGTVSATDLEACGATVDQIEKAEMHGCIREYIDRLSPDHRRILALKDLEGRTNAEIAQELGIGLEAAKIRLHRARAKLRVEMEAGCDLYHTRENTLACDRKKPSGCCG